jgi:hypothetical protein
MTSVQEATEKSVKPPVKSAKVKSGPLTEGSTRTRLFRALAKFPGISAAKIKEKTGMLPNSGHLNVLLGEEIEAKRIRVEEHEPQEDNSDRSRLCYFLTAKGKKDLEQGKVDLRGTGNGLIGKKWTKARRIATPATK